MPEATGPVRRRVVHVTTVPMSLRFLRGQAAFMRERGYDLAAVSSPGDELDAFGDDEGVPVRGVAMSRQISPVADVRSLLKLRRALRQLKPDLVHAHTPKGGLLGMAAAASIRVPRRIYHVRGLPLMGASGRRRELLRRAERASARLAGRVLCVSRSLREVVVDEDICPPDKVRVLAGGSGNGVDADVWFNPDRLRFDTRDKVRAKHGIPADATVIGFVGRIVGDKGVRELLAAFASLRPRFPEARLLVIGPAEERDALPPEALQKLREGEGVHWIGPAWETPPLYAAMDVVALPSYREGFPNVPLEAAAMGLPCVVTNVPGCVDAVLHNATGLHVPPRDAGALAAALAAYLSDAKLRRRHGAAGRERVRREFRQAVVWQALADEYDALFAGRPA